LVTLVGSEVPDALLGDPVRLRQVVVYLVGNAVKFTDRGEIVVRASVEEAAETSVELHLVVEDTGPGIPEDQLRSIFEAFRQVDGSLTRRHGGTGLGLTISERLVTLMGGRIWVESELGQGSRFHVTLRLDRQVDRTQPVLHHDAARLAGLPVLVVDDNQTNRRVLDGLLRSWQMRPHVVGDGRAALAVLAESAREGERLPLMVVDAAMPDLDGFEVAERVRATGADRCPAVVMLSSAVVPNARARCEAAGIAACLTKPVDPTDLCEALLRAVDLSGQDAKNAGLPAGPAGEAGAGPPRGGPHGD
jgi:CheY-like chemotaxis protein